MRLRRGKGIVRRALWLLAVAAVVVAGVFVVGSSRRRAREPNYTYDPVVAKTALDAWTPSWPAPSAAAGAAAAPRRWMVIGWDGASWDIALPLLDAGKMPNLAALMREGAYGDLYSFKPTWSPVLWTTVATGVDPGRHGILAWGRTEDDGKTRRLFSNADRRVRALWNLLTDAGKTALVVGYHNTFPADRIRGVMVSNYLYQEHLASTMGANVDPLASRSGLVFPPERVKDVLAVQSDVANSLPSTIRRFATYRAEEAAAFETPLTSGLAPGQDRRLFFLKKAYLFDEFNARVAAAEYPRVAPDVLMVHFQCLDLVGHYFLYFHEPARFASMSWTPEQREKLAAQERFYGGTVEAFYRWMDEWLGRLLALRPADCGVILLSDHGFEPEPDADRTGYHVSAPPGVFVVAGPGVRPGFRPEAASLYDVLPTIVATTGLPVARDLRGRVMGSWFEPEAWGRVRVTTVPSYETKERFVPDVPEPSAVDADVLEQLKALGYIR